MHAAFDAPFDDVFVVHVADVTLGGMDNNVFELVVELTSERRHVIES